MQPRVPPSLHFALSRSDSHRVYYFPPLSPSLAATLSCSSLLRRRVEQSDQLLSYNKMVTWSVTIQSIFDRPLEKFWKGFL